MPGADDRYWRSAADDEVMQDEHGFIWEAMLRTIDLDLRGARVLDAGCNRGGFLRLLCERCGIAEGFGYDPAGGAVADAARLSAGLPLHFAVADTVPAGWDGFHAAFSHEVLYLLHDLGAHAEAVFAALAPGAPYFAVMGVHAGSPLMVEWHAAAAQELGLPRLYDVDEVVDVFAGAGFDVAAARLALGFVPAHAHRQGPHAAGAHRHGPDAAGAFLDWLDYYAEHKLLFRFRRT